MQPSEVMTWKFSYGLTKVWWKTQLTIQGLCLPKVPVLKPYPRYDVVGGCGRKLGQVVRAEPQ